MTNEQAIIELRDLISDDRTDRENEALLLAIEKLRDNAPTVEQPTGEWIEENGIPICSECNNGYNTQPRCMGKPMFAFCPICGAKMKEGEDK